MKILVDREDIQRIYDLMEDPCKGTICVEARDLLRKILEENKSFDKEFTELKKRVVYLEEMTGHCLLFKGY